jgi:iron complex transport system substrate-binding protein
MVNIADEAAEAAGTVFPQMAEEAIIEADPHLVYTTSGATPEDVAQRPGWGDVQAVVDDAVVMLPPDIPSRWGPRVVEFVQVVADSLDAAVAAQ